jgi:beta-lactamase regulating signal transducer with metallopeptidase domain
MVAIAFIASTLLRKESAAVRHLAWRYCAIALLLLPLPAGFVHGLSVRAWPSIAGPAPSKVAALPPKATAGQATSAREPNGAATDIDTSRRVGAAKPSAPHTIPAGGRARTVAGASTPERFLRQAPQARVPILPGLLFLAWLCGVAAAIAQTAAGLIALFILRRRAHAAPESIQALALSITRDMGDQRQVTVMMSHAVSMPMTYGAPRALVMLPADSEEWTEERKTAVLRHEIAHVVRGDWPVQIAARIACAFYWFNPGVWLMARKLRLEADIACDDAAIAAVAPASYARELLTLARERGGGQCAPALPMAGASPLEERLRSIVSASARRRPAARGAAQAGAFAARIAGVMVAGIWKGTGAPLPIGPSLAPPLMTRMAGTSPVNLYDARWVADSNPADRPEKSLQFRIGFAPNSHFRFWLTDANGRVMRDVEYGSSISTVTTGTECVETTGGRFLNPRLGHVNLVAETEDESAPKGADGVQPEQTLDFGDVPVPGAGNPTIAIGRSAMTPTGTRVILEKMGLRKTIGTAVPQIVLGFRWTAPPGVPDMSLAFTCSPTNIRDDQGRKIPVSFNTVQDNSVVSGLGAMQLSFPAAQAGNSRAIHVGLTVTEQAKSLRQARYFHTVSFPLDLLKLPGAAADRPYADVASARVGNMRVGLEYLVRNGPGVYTLRFHAAGRRMSADTALKAADVSLVGDKIRSYSWVTSDMGTPFFEHPYWRMDGAPAQPGELIQEVCFNSVSPAPRGPLNLSISLQPCRKKAAHVTFAGLPIPSPGHPIAVNRAFQDTAGRVWRVLSVAAYTPETALPGFKPEDLTNISPQYGLIVTAMPSPAALFQADREDEFEDARDSNGVSLDYASGSQLDYASSRAGAPYGGAPRNATPISYFFQSPSPGARSVTVTVSWTEVTQAGPTTEVRLNNLKPTPPMW